MLLLKLSILIKMTIQQIFEKHSNLTSLSEGNYGYFMDEKDFASATKKLIDLKNYEKRRCFSTIRDFTKGSK